MPARSSFVRWARAGTSRWRGESNFGYSDAIMPQPIDPVEEPKGPETPAQPAAPITSRFLFVDVAAQRAKQLRRGALPRVDRAQAAAPAPHKLERVAMEEVRTGLIQYTLPTNYEGAGSKTPRS
jgi:DNA-directed RNA polymerase subunit K/omega